MNPYEFAFGAFLVLILCGLAGYFAWRQLQTLRSLRGQTNLSDLDRRYLCRQAWRRLGCSFLMIVSAGLLVGWWFFLDSDYRKWEEVRERWAGAKTPILEPEHWAFVRAFTFYWITALLVLLALVTLAAIDLWAIARYGLRHHRQLKADHHALLQDQASRLRGRHNGQQ